MQVLNYIPEALASEIINYADPESVRYTVVKLHKRNSNEMQSFTNEETGFVPLRKLVYKNTHYGRTFTILLTSLDALKKFQRMLVLDAITLMLTGILAIWACFVDNDTQEITGLLLILISICPCFPCHKRGNLMT